MPDVLGEIVPYVGAKVWESAKAMGFKYIIKEKKEEEEEIGE